MKATFVQNMQIMECFRAKIPNINTCISRQTVGPECVESICSKFKDKRLSMIGHR